MDIASQAKFHTARRDKLIEITIQKSPTPMLWLDTSVLIDLAKIDANIPIEAVRAKRLKKLRLAVREAVRRESLICPEWDQSQEYEAGQHEKAIQRVISDLSCGAHCVPHAGVKDAQISRSLLAYFDLASAVHIPSNIHFHRDPLEAIRIAKQNGFIIESALRKPQEWIDKAKKDKATTQISIEELRVEFTGDRQTFENQLSLERNGESDVMLKMVAAYMKSASEGKHDFWEYMGVEGHLRHIAEWRSISGEPSFHSALAALYSYMRSHYYWDLPIQDIACRLSADLMVKHFPVKSGDSADIQHLATAIPVAHFIVADKAMVDRCKRLKIGQKWSTKIFATKTLDDLSDEISTL